MKREYHFYAYIMASRSLNFYVGMCNNLVRRVREHKEGKIEGFTKRYNINRLVYYQTFQYVDNSINREKQQKGLSRAKKIALIKSVNPGWADLSEGWYDDVPARPTKKKMQIPRPARDDNSERGYQEKGMDA